MLRSVHGLALLTLPLLLTAVFVMPTRSSAQVPGPLVAPPQPGPTLHNPPPPPGSPPHGQHAVNPPPKNAAASEEARKKLREKIRAIRTRKLAEVIQPDPATTQKLTEIAEKFEEQLEQTRLLARTTRRDLLKGLQAPKPDDANVARLTDQLISQRAKMQQIETAREAAVRAVLKPVQFAKLEIGRAHV